MAICRPIQAVLISIFAVQDWSLFSCDAVLIFLYVLYIIMRRLRTCECSIISQKTLIVIAVPVSVFSFQFVSDVILMSCSWTWSIFWECLWNFPVLIHKLFHKISGPESACPSGTCFDCAIAWKISLVLCWPFSYSSSSSPPQPRIVNESSVQTHTEPVLSIPANHFVS